VADRRALAAALAAGATLSAAAQDDPDGTFVRTAIPEGMAVRFVCHQHGETIVDLADVATFAPDRIKGVMTFSVNTRDGKTYLIYLGEATSCRLEAQRPAE